MYHCCTIRLFASSSCQRNSYPQLESLIQPILGVILAQPRGNDDLANDSKVAGEDSRILSCLKSANFLHSRREMVVLRIHTSMSTQQQQLKPSEQALSNNSPCPIIWYSKHVVASAHEPTLSSASCDIDILTAETNERGETRRCINTYFILPRKHEEERGSGRKKTGAIMNS